MSAQQIMPKGAKNAAILCDEYATSGSVLNAYLVHGKSSSAQLVFERELVYSSLQVRSYF